MKPRTLFLHSIFFSLIFLASLSVWGGDKYRVLVVMSYEQDNPWCQEIRDGIESALGSVSDITYVYLDTKADFKGGQKKADAAYELYSTLQPDGVIAADDNAQSMFVVPYLKDKVSTPVMFCGVNSEADKYGYPAHNVSGSLERGHIRESIAFLRQLKDDINRICFLVRKSPSGGALRQQVEQEKSSYLAEVSGFFQVQNTSEFADLAPRLESQCDAIYLDSLEGIIDDKGVSLSHKEVCRSLEMVYSGLFIGANKYHVDQGALSAVVKTGQEQGEAAGALLLKALQGTPVSNIAVTRNYRGKRFINVTTMKKLGIKVRPIVLRSASFVTTEK